MMPMIKRRPAGQSLIELLLVLGVLSGMLVMTMVVGVIGDTGIRTSMAARLAAFECDVRPGACSASAAASAAHARSVVLHDDRGDVLAAEAGATLPDSPRRGRVIRTLHRDQHVIEHDSDVHLSIDLPRVDGADTNLLAKLSDIFRRFGMGSGPALFGLPSPDQLTRSTVHTTMWSSRAPAVTPMGLPKISMSSRVAMISDSWAASDRPEFFSRVDHGKTPSSIVAGSVEAFYIPAKDLLMPVMDAVGLESGTSAFRSSFHRPDHDQVFSDTRRRLP